MATTTPARRRNAGLKVNLNPAVIENLRSIADAIGMTPAALASYAIGSYVRQQMHTIGMVEKMAESAAPAIQQMVEAEQLSLLRLAKGEDQ